MKFAKELESDLVPEWKDAYFDYKTGKKKVKAVSRAIRNARKSPALSGRRLDNVSEGLVGYARRPRSTSRDGHLDGRSQTPQALLQLSNARVQRSGSGAALRLDHDRNQVLQARQDEEEERSDSTGSRSPKLAEGRPAARAIPITRKPGVGEEDVVYNREGRALMRYGSILGSPPSPLALSRPATLNLPDPALDSEDDLLGKDRTQRRLDPFESRRRTTGAASAHEPRSPSSAYEVGTTKHPIHKGSLGLPGSRRVGPLRSHSHIETSQSSQTTPSGAKPLFKRLFTPMSAVATRFVADDVPLEAREDITKRDNEFQMFLNQELEKIEKFYTEKENDAQIRLEQLREQLHFMASNHVAELKDRKRQEDERHRRSQASIANMGGTKTSGGDSRHEGLVGVPPSDMDRQTTISTFQSSKDAHDHRKGSILSHLPSMYGHDLMRPINAAKQVHFRKVPSPNYLATPPDTFSQDKNNDFEKRPQNMGVPYHKAKRKLKYAMQEFYRSLELLKAYVLLNRTAFRKINKKYDKAVFSRTPMRFMFEKVNKAYFVQSGVLESSITTVEDLYARYFEQGNHKVAVGKLRKKISHDGNYSGSTFRNGILLGLGAVFGIQGLVRAIERLTSIDPSRHTQTSYLLQLYGGYFLFLLLFLLFCIDCKWFDEAKVNYVFIFEFDAHHHLNWRQLAEVPCLFLGMLGLIMWLNFTMVGGDAMYVYWPVVLIGVSVVILFLPVRTLYWRSRLWFVVAVGRLALSPLFPVEFRDFFLGDMFCSQSYAMGNIELFFCLYAGHWNDAPTCNSSNSKLLGFFQALPGIWRLLQCGRRYRDTKKGFPHLVNGGKYTMTILYYMFLSLYRIYRGVHYRALFITFGSINAVYASFWDLVMDWSLCDSPTFLRSQLTYKGDWKYYLAMIVDVIIRFNYIFYAIFPADNQHSAVLSFAIALSEVFRRFIWTAIRVENEHTTNVRSLRAGREPNLPYKPYKDGAADFERSQKANRSDPSADLSSSDDSPTTADPTINSSSKKTKNKTKSKKQTPSTDHTAIKAAAVPRKSPGMTSEDGSNSGAINALTRTKTRESAISSLRRRIGYSSGAADEEAETAGGSTTPKTPGAPSSSSIRARVGTLISTAHAQDFERKRSRSDDEDGGAEDESSDDDDEDMGGSGSHAEDGGDVGVDVEARRRDEEAWIGRSGGGGGHWGGNGRAGLDGDGGSSGGSGGSGGSGSGFMKGKQVMQDLEVQERQIPAQEDYLRNREREGNTTGEGAAHEEHEEVGVDAVPDMRDSTEGATR